MFFMKRDVLCAALAIVAAACVSTSDNDRARAARVRIVNNAEAVRGCQPIGSVTDDDIEDLHKRRRLGGDVALTMQSQGLAAVRACRRGRSVTPHTQRLRCTVCAPK